MLDINEIMKIIPQRPPILMIDKVEELIPGESCVAYKNVCINEPYFEGHFPGNPIMPGVLIAESLAQTGAVAILSMEKPVLPGDVLKLEVKIIKQKGPIGIGEAIATVDGKVAAKGELTFAIV